MFFNEVDLLELRLRELEDVVDEFVFVESLFTHSGNPKKLYFREEMGTGKYDDLIEAGKITYLILGAFPDDLTSLQRENYQRNYLMNALHTLDDDDTIMISDCDEIPTPETVLSYKASQGAVTVDHQYYCYYYNCRTPHRWRGTVILNGKSAKGHTPQNYRDIKDTLPVHGTGWHFGYLGGADAIKHKLQSFLHDEYAGLGEDYIASRLEKTVDLYQDVQFEVFQNLDELPRYLQDNPDKYKTFLHT